MNTNEKKYWAKREKMADRVALSIAIGLPALLIAGNAINKLIGALVY